MNKNRNPIENDQVIVNLLSAEAKALLWRGMQALDPEQAAGVKDPIFQAMKDSIDALAREAGPIRPCDECSVTVTLKDYRRFVKWAMDNPPAEKPKTEAA